MDKIYYHSFKKKDVLLAKADGKCSFIINCNSDKVCFVMFTNNGYFLEGSIIKGIDFYKKGSSFYIVNTTDSDNYFITIQPLSVSGVGSFETCYGESFDSTGFTKLERLKDKVPIVNTGFTSSYYDANAVVSYDMQLKNTTNYAQSALLLISARDVNGIGGSALVLVSSVNNSSINDFTTLIMASSEQFNLFTVNGTNNGISITHNTKFKFSITEITGNII